MRKIVSLVVVALVSLVAALAFAAGPETRSPVAFSRETPEPAPVDLSSAGSLVQTTAPVVIVAKARKPHAPAPVKPARVARCYVRPLLSDAVGVVRVCE